VPPGPGLFTVICALPRLFTWSAVSDTCSVVLFTKVVGTAVPFHKTEEFDSKPLPEIVMLAAVACGTLLGESPVICGVGLMTEKFIAVDAPPPGEGLVTVTGASTPPVNAEAGTWAWSDVALVKVVGTAVPLKDTTAP
jgi:hypothetical protein